MDGAVGFHFRSIFCSPFTSLFRICFGSGLLTSACFGLLGSVCQLLLWKSYLKKYDTRHKPSSNPHIVFNLALCNALSCLSTNQFLVNSLIFRYYASYSVWHPGTVGCNLWCYWKLQLGSDGNPCCRWGGKYGGCTHMRYFLETGISHLIKRAFIELGGNDASVVHYRIKIFCCFYLMLL